MQPCDFPRYRGIYGLSVVITDAAISETALQERLFPAKAGSEFRKRFALDLPHQLFVDTKIPGGFFSLQPKVIEQRKYAILGWRQAPAGFL
jgi:hypothetical protein